MPELSDNLSQANSSHRRDFWHFVIVAVPFIVSLLAICFTITPILKALATHGWQDVYWEECFTDSTQHKASNYNHYYIKNNSVVKTPRLTFTFVANVPTKNILCSNGQDIEQLKEKVYDPNSHYVLAIDGCGNDIKSKQDNAGSTRMWVEYNKGLEKNSDTKIALYWASNKKQVLYDEKQLYKGTPNTKDEDKTIYPTASNRKLLIKHLGKLIIAVFLILPYVVYRIYAKKVKIKVRVCKFEGILEGIEEPLKITLQEIYSQVTQLNGKQIETEKEISFLKGKADLAYGLKAAIANIGDDIKEKLAVEKNEEFMPQLTEQLKKETAPDSQSSKGSEISESPVGGIPIVTSDGKKNGKGRKSKKKKSDELESSEKNSESSQK